jgi:hypothetical protein
MVPSAPPAGRRRRRRQAYAYPRTPRANLSRTSFLAAPQNAANLKQRERERADVRGYSITAMVKREEREREGRMREKRIA